MAVTQQIEHRLRYADVRLDPYNGDLVGYLGAFGERVAQFWHEHREGGLVDGVEGRAGEFGADWSTV